MNKKKLLKVIVAFTCIIVFFIIMLNPSYKYNKLIISESKWNEIQQNRIESNNLSLEDLSFNGYKLIVDENNNTVYYSLVNESKNKYNPTIKYNANSNNVKLVILSDEINDERVKTNYLFKIMIYNEKEYHVYNLKCTDYPILNISYNREDEAKQKNIPMEMYLFDNLSNIPNKITISSGKVKFNDDNIVFSLHMLTPGKNKWDNKLSILNMKPNSEFVLTKDNNLQTQNKMHKVELFLNNEYKGIYLLENRNIQP